MILTVAALRAADAAAVNRLHNIWTSSYGDLAFQRKCLSNGRQQS